MIQMPGTLSGVLGFIRLRWCLLIVVLVIVMAAVAPAVVPFLLPPSPIELAVVTDARSQLRRRLRRRSLLGNPARDALRAAARHGREEMMIIVLDESISPDTVLDKKGRMAMHHAAAQGRGRTVSLLLSRGAHPEARDHYGWTPLHWAAREGRGEVAAQLLEHGAGVDSRDVFGWTPLHVACAQGRATVAAILLAHGADPDVQLAAPNDSDRFRLPEGELARWGYAFTVWACNRRLVGASTLGEAPLHLAVAAKNPMLVETLLGAGAGPNLKAPFREETPLHFAARKGYTQVAEALLAGGADASATDRVDYTPADRARRAGHESLARLLEREDADE